MNQPSSDKSLRTKMGIRLHRLGARTLTAMAAALIAAVLLFLSPEIGLAGAIGGVVVGAVSAILIRPHMHM